MPQVKITVDKMKTLKEMIELGTDYLLIYIA